MPSYQPLLGTTWFLTLSWNLSTLHSVHKRDAPAGEDTTTQAIEFFLLPVWWMAVSSFVYHIQCCTSCIYIYINPNSSPVEICNTCAECWRCLVLGHFALCTRCIELHHCVLRMAWIFSRSEFYSACVLMLLNNRMGLNQLYMWTIGAYCGSDNNLVSLSTIKWMLCRKFVSHSFTIRLYLIIKREKAGTNEHYHVVIFLDDLNSIL